MQQTPIKIKGYQVLEQIGQGSSGVIYKGLQESTQKLVAIKCINTSVAQNARWKARFMREARIATELRHPNIVKGIACGEEDELIYFIMEYVTGERLDTLVYNHGPFSEERALQLATEMSAALTCAWQADIVHRDIKPGNILLCPNGHFKLCDLGLARSASDDRVTITGTVVGTAYFIAPEQARGNPQLDIRSDIYSLGATLFYVATATFPYQGDNLIDVIRQHLYAAIPAPSAIRASLSPGFDHLIGKMMAKSPESRPQTPLELAQEIRKVQKWLRLH